MDRKEFLGPINIDIVKKYYAWGHKKKVLSELKTWKGRFWHEKKKRKKFKVKIRKDSLNHLKKSKGQVENSKKVIWLQRGYLD